MSDHKQQELDQLAINTLRFLAVDQVEAAKSGHPGAPLGCAPIAYLLYTKFMKYDPQEPLWSDRDRFVLSNGHASALLYGALHLSGFDLPMDQLKQFRQWGSHTPGHPEYGETPGVEVTTGPLGQGFAEAVGLAIAEKHLAAVYNQAGDTSSTTTATPRRSLHLRAVRRRRPDGRHLARELARWPARSAWAS